MRDIANSPTIQTAGLKQIHHEITKSLINPNRRNH